MKGTQKDREIIDTHLLRLKPIQSVLTNLSFLLISTKIIDKKLNSKEKN